MTQGDSMADIAGGHCQSGPGGKSPFHAPLVDSASGMHCKGTTRRAGTASLRANASSTSGIDAVAKTASRLPLPRTQFKLLIFSNWQTSCF